MNTETYLKAVALKRMPPNLQTVDLLKAGTAWFVISSTFPLFHHYKVLSDGGIYSDTLTHTHTIHVFPVPEPCLDSFVFLRVNERQENILVEPETDEQRYLHCHWLNNPLDGSVSLNI